MNCRVVVGVAIPVCGVGTVSEAIHIATSKTGGMFNPNLKYVETNIGTRTSPNGEEFPPAFIVADEALITLRLGMAVFNIEQEEHASRIARKEIDQHLENILLKVLPVGRADHESVETGGEDGTRTETGAFDPDEMLVDLDDLVDGH